MMNDLLLEKAAIAFRTENGLGASEAIRLKSLLQKINVITLFSPLTDGFSGMALKTVNKGKVARFMLVNCEHPLGKQHFTICHELYHLYVQPDFSSRICKTGTFNKSDKEEYRADIFASYLLLPKEGLLELIPNHELEKKLITLPTIVYLENYFSCSRRALLYRLKKEQLLTSKQYDEYCVNVKLSAAENGYDISLYEPGNRNIVIGNYGSKAKALFERERISESHYYTLLTDLGIDIRRFENLMNDDQ